jgi:sporulation integral membrane protein YtvI
MSTIWKKLELYTKAIINIIIFCALTLAAIYFIPQLLIFFMPFVVGGIIAWIASPIVRFCERKLKLRRKFTTAFVIILVISIIITLAYFAGVWLTNQVIGFIAEWPLMWAGIQREVIAIAERLTVAVEGLPDEIQAPLMDLPATLSTYLADMVSIISVPTFEAFGRFASNLPLIIINIAMCLLSAYFFIAERDYISGIINYIPRGIASKLILMSDSIKRSVGGYFKAQFKIEIWIYLLMVLGFLILQVEYGFLIAFIIAIFDFLPIFGTGLVLFPWAFIKLFNGDYFMFAGLLIIQVVGQLVRQLIQPKIMGDTIGVPPVPTLFLLYVGFRFGGIFGMIVALPIAIVLMNLYQAGVFETTKKSVSILIGGLNRFRRL